MQLKKLISVILFDSLLLNASMLWAGLGGVTEQSSFMVGPVGEIVYADTTVVSDSECYEVIFTADGYQFAGFTTDGHLVDPSHSAVVTYGTISEIRTGIKCEMGTRAEVKDEYLDPLNCTDGVFELYLLDSRVGSGFAPIDDEGENPTYLPTTINAWAKANGSNTIKYSDLKFDRTVGINSGSITTTQKTIIGVATPVPVIVSIAYTNGAATIEATNTVSTASYLLKGSLDLSFTNTCWNCETKAGAADVLTALTISDTNATHSAAFYRLEVVK